MSERKINLEEIIKLYSLSDTITTRQSFIYFGKQLLELAAENADCEEGAIVDLGFEIISASINKDSILNTIRQVE